jgi:hypothetical protein
VRNKYFKGCFDTKDITAFSDYNNVVAIFEGFFDFLSFLTFHKDHDLGYDFIILNSLTMLPVLKDNLERYSLVELYFDNDEAGDKATKEIQGNITLAEDKRSLYKNFKDLNEALMADIQIFN